MQQLKSVKAISDQVSSSKDDLLKKVKKNKQTNKLRTEIQIRKLISFEQKTKIRSSSSNMKNLSEFGKYIEIKRIHNECHIWNINADNREAANEELLTHKQLGQQQNNCNLKMSLKEMEKILEPVIIRLTKRIASQENLSKLISSLNMADKETQTEAESILIAYIEIKMDWQDTSEYNLEEDVDTRGLKINDCKCFKQNSQQKEQSLRKDRKEEQKNCQDNDHKDKYGTCLGESIKINETNQLQDKDQKSSETSNDIVVLAQTKIDQIAAQQNYDDGEVAPLKVYKKGKESKQNANILQNIQNIVQKCSDLKESHFDKSFENNPSQFKNLQKQYHCRCNSKIIDNPFQIDWKSLQQFFIEKIDCKFILRPVDAIDNGVVLQGDEKLVQLQKESDILNSGITITFGQLNLEFIEANNENQDILEIPERVSSYQNIVFPGISPLVVQIDLRKISSSIIDQLKLYFCFGFPQKRPYLQYLFKGEVEAFLEKTKFLHPNNRKKRLLVSFVPALLNPPGTSLAIVASKQIQESAIDHVNLENEMVFNLILFHKIGFQFIILNSLPIVLFDLLFDEQ